MAGYDCDHGKVLCNALPPLCEAGTVPSVVNGCWGPCVLVTECKSVTSCSDCAAPLQTCVNVQHQTGPTLHFLKESPREMKSEDGWPLRHELRRCANKGSRRAQ